jgi:hypothetical protein
VSRDEIQKARLQEGRGGMLGCRFHLNGAFPPFCPGTVSYFFEIARKYKVRRKTSKSGFQGTQLSVLFFEDCFLSH